MGTQPCVPMRWLQKQGLLHGRILDYGCGCGVCADHIGAEKYDPYWFPERPEEVFDVVTCNYVLNVISSEEERREVLADIVSLLSLGGVAYVSVRNDPDVKQGFLPNGAYQGLITLDEPWEMMRETSRFRLYKYQPKDKTMKMFKEIDCGTQFVRVDDPPKTRLIYVKINQTTARAWCAHEHTEQFDDYEKVILL